MTANRRRKLQKSILQAFLFAREWIGTDVARERVVWKHHNNHPNVMAADRQHFDDR